MICWLTMMMPVLLVALAVQIKNPALWPGNLPARNASRMSTRRSIHGKQGTKNRITKARRRAEGKHQKVRIGANLGLIKDFGGCVRYSLTDELWVIMAIAKNA